MMLSGVECHKNMEFDLNNEMNRFAGIFLPSVVNFKL